MKTFQMISAVAILALSSMPSFAGGLKDRLVGTWSIVSNVETWDDGKKVSWGPDLKGLLIFDAGGHYSFQMGVGGRPKGQGNPADEPKGKYVGYIGTYELIEAENALELAVARCTSPNLEGGVQKRTIISLNDTELVYKAVQPIMAGGHKIIPTLTFKKLN